MLTEAKLRKRVYEATFKRGSSLFNAGGVLEMEEENQGNRMLIRAKVQGSGSRAYDVELLMDESEDKILEFPMGLIGFENLKKFAIIYDSDREVRSKISWLQSMEEPALALPIIHPSELIDDYGPIVEDELMKNIGDPADADILMFVTLSIPSDLTKMTANLKAPIIINTEGRKAIQVIVENEDYKVKFNAYEAIQKMKEKAGE